MTIRRTHVGGMLVLGIAACVFPTESCGCSPLQPAAKAFGFVRSANGIPLGGATVTLSAGRAPCDDAALSSPYMTQVTTLADGRYSAVTTSPTLGSTCVAVRATSGAATSAPATAIVNSAAVSWERLDSVRVDLHVP